jgi:hypothetical protein
MDDLLLDPSGATGGGFDIVAWVAQFGDNPLVAMGSIIVNGGWVILVWALLWGARELWLDWRQALYKKKLRHVLLAIDVPRSTEQTVKAVENMFSHLAGAHRPPTFLEKWVDGEVQDTVTVELVSIEGHIQYLLHTTVKMRDLVEASIYAQYPDAEITEVEDYTTSLPHHFPDEKYDCWGCEFIPVKNDVYPLKSYIDFEHQLTGEYKDPLAVILEAFSRMGPGEHVWWQIVMTPIDQKEFYGKAMKEIRKITGQKEPEHHTMVDKALDLPIHALGMVGSAVFGSGEADGHKKKEENPFNSRMFNLTPGERKLVETVERKMSKIAFKVKIRFLFFGPKQTFNKGRVVGSFIGGLKQFNTNDAQALKPESKHVGVSSSIIFFKKQRNNVRKTHLVHAYRKRSNWAGCDNFFMSAEELASLWHLPVSLFVKAPQIKKTESKKGEPPINLPMG